MKRFLEVTTDGVVRGYVANTNGGRDVADRFLQNHAKRTGSARPVDRIPQGARRLDR